MPFVVCTDVSVLAADIYFCSILREKGWTSGWKAVTFLETLCSTTAAFVTFFVFMNFLTVYKLKLFMAFLAGVLCVCLYIGMQQLLSFVNCSVYIVTQGAVLSADTYLVGQGLFCILFILHQAFSAFKYAWQPSFPCELTCESCEKQYLNVP